MNKMRAVCFAFLVLLLTETSIAQNALTGKLSLKQCVETGINNNLDVQQSGLLMERSKIDWNQARLNLLPSLNGNAGITFAQGRTVDQATNTYINTNANYS